MVEVVEPATRADSQLKINFLYNLGADHTENNAYNSFSVILITLYEHQHNK
jgi:hypothetical protein